MEKKKKKFGIFPLDKMDILSVGIVLGFALSYAIGMTYIAAVKDMNRRVFETYSIEMRNQIKDMPVSTQLIASFASRQAMSKALKENENTSLWYAMFFVPPIDSSRED